MRCVLDTNVLISAALTPHGTTRRVLEAVLRDDTLLGSRQTIDEFVSRFLPRAKFDRYLSRARREAYADRVIALTEVIAVTSRLSVCLDPDDDRFLELAVDGGADCLVTGNARDFPAAHAGVAVLTPAAFAEAWM